MRRIQKSKKRAGRVRIDLVSAGSGNVLVTVARACNDPAVLKLADELLDGIARHSNVTIKNIEPEVPLSVLARRRGGPAGMPETQRIEIVKGWFKVRGRTKEVDYARSRGISPATLRRWIRELLQAGKL